MNRIFILLLPFTFTMTVFAQSDFGIKLNGGLSRISNSAQKEVYNTTWMVQLAPSGQGGIFYNFHFGEKSVLGAELLFVQIEGKEQIEFVLTDENGNNAGHVTDKVYKHISYLGCPVYYGLQLNKVSINIGAQASFTLISSARSKGQAIYNDTITRFSNKYDKLNIKKYDFGLRAGIIFKLTDKISFEGNYYFGLNNIFNNQTLYWTWRVQQATIGVKYNLRTTVPKMEETIK